MGLTNKRHEVTKRVSMSQTYFADYFYYLLLIYIIFLYTDIHSLMMLRRTFEECGYRSVLCSHLGLVYFRIIQTMQNTLTETVLIRLCTLIVCRSHFI